MIPYRIVNELADEIFPFTIACDRNGYSSPQYRKHFDSVRGDMTWYGYDTKIKSREDVEFIVYDMYDNFSGGIGKVIATLNVKVPADLTESDVDRRIMRLAEKYRAKELADMEAKIISDYATEIRIGLIHKTSENANA